MRRKTNILLFIICLFAVISACNNRTEDAETNIVNTENIYIIETKIIDFEESSDLVITESESGKLYTFQGIEDWEISDRCILVFDDNRTETLTDDKIIRTFYRR